MSVRYWVVLLFLHLIDKVSLQGPVEINGFVGDSVVLPCSYSERVLKSEEINVFWRYNQTIKVYDIEKGKTFPKKQDAMFKDRMESFPSEHANGNFSLRLVSLRFTDEGLFSCGIPDVLKKYELALKVRAKTTTVSTPKSTVPASSSVTAQPKGIVTFLIRYFGFFYFAIIRIIC